MKVYVLIITSQLGQGDQPSSIVLGVYESRERAVQAHHAAVVDEMAEYVENYDEVATRDTYLGTLITRPSDDSCWTLIQLHESEML
ncbi:MAG: hypothetical protein IJY67_04305 [Paludibacteraceae bacterium]|nr:hypothetical protein [Paludibacteraceae bacterium]